MYFESDSRHILIDQFRFENITSTNQMILFRNDGSGTNITIQNSRFKNLNGETMSGNTLEMSKLYFRNNLFQNIYTNQDLQIFRCAFLYDSEFCSNIFQNLTSNLYATRVFLFVNICSRNLIFNNTFANFTSRNAEESCMEMYSGCVDNRIYYNRFMTSSMLIEEKGDNIYQGVVYFAPYQSEMVVGNYWCDHAFDNDPTLHYFVNTPRIMNGNPNGTDYVPLHYFGMDFDGDGLINYYELAYGWQVWNPDTDNDGILDGLESPPSPAVPITNGTNSNSTEAAETWDFSAWSSILENPQTVALFLIALLLVINLLRRPKIVSSVTEKNITVSEKSSPAKPKETPNPLKDSTDKKKQ